MRKAVVLWLITAVSLWAYGQDTVYSTDTVNSIGEVVVTSKLISREVVPSQKLKGDQLRRLNSHNVADALRYFSGIQLKDYGGVGGIKTVNIRSMGSHHLGIYYDGIELSNAQNGQIDLGQYSLDNVEEVSLYNGQRSAIFQTASDFGNAGSIYIRTRVPHFGYGEKSHQRWSVKYGSMDHLRLSGLYEQRLTDDVGLSVSAGFVSSSGKYKFRYRRLNIDHTVAWDTTATRQNGDIHAERLELNVHGSIEQGYWNIKGYFYNSERGIPGAIVNNVWHRAERQWDLNTFLQGAWQKSFGQRFSTRFMGKWAYYKTRYKNNDETQLPVDNTYYQQEFYATTSNVFELLKGWCVSVSYDARWNKLNATTYRFSYPTRWSHLVSVATSLDYPRLKAQASLLSSSIIDHTRTDDAHHSLHRLTPAVSMSIYPLPTRDLSLRAYAKKSFRMPTFNDLYYTDLGNAYLKPESAIQYNVGLVFNHHYRKGLVRHVGVQADGYYNSVHDKIVAYPKGQQFRWTMLNLGRVHIHGIDIVAEADFTPLEGLTVTTRAQYSYQDARDVTDPTTPYYRDQIPYIPWHSGSAILGLAWKGWTLNYSFIYAGERYNGQENIIYNYMEPWYTNDVSVCYDFDWRKTHWRVQLEVNNLLSQDYDVILNYPMPKRNYAVGVNIQI